MATEELKLIISVEKDSAVSGIKLVQEAEKDLQNETKQTQSSFTELNSIFELSRKAFDVVAGAASLAIDAIKEGSRIDDVASAFKRLSAEAGTTSDVFLNQLQVATGSTISNFELMLKANEALKKGLTADQFSQVASAARELSDTLGTDLNAEISALSTALETGNTRILQNKIGIIDLKTAEEELANTLGIKREALNREQQVMAARTAIMAAMNDEAERGRNIENDNADLIDQITASFTNQTNALKQSLGSNIEMNDALKQMRDLLISMDFKPIINGLTSLATNAVKAANVLIDAFSNAGNYFDLLKASFDQFAYSQTAVSTKAVELRERFIALTTALKPTIENQKKAVDTITELRQEYVAVMAKMQDAGKSQDDINNLFEKGTTDIQNLTLKFQTWKESISDAKTELDAIPDQSSKQVDLIIKATRPDGSTTKPGGKDMGLGEFEPGRSGKPDWLSSTLREDVASQFQSDMESALAQGLGNALNAVFSGANSEDYKQISRQLGSQSGAAAGKAIGGPIGEAIGSVIGDKLGKAVFDGFNHIFGGGRDEGTKMRKNVEAFFDNLLKDADLKIIKDDQLIDLKEFNRLGDAFEENWVGHFEEIAGSSFGAFASIGEGFAGLFDDAEKYGGQIGYILAENLGGSLNNLQLMFYKTGLGVEELGEKMIDAFLDGKISADQFTAAMASIQQVMTDGIPDGVGLTVQALDNLVASSGRGIASIDAVKDIIFEGMEAGAKTFDDLKKNLLDAGASAEQVEALFATFSKLNITSFEQITGASNEFLISLIANLDDAGFQFATLSTDVEDLSQKLDDLEREREIPITLRVNTIADATAQSIIDSGNLPGVA